MVCTLDSSSTVERKLSLPSVTFFPLERCPRVLLSVTWRRSWVTEERLPEPPVTTPLLSPTTPIPTRPGLRCPPAARRLSTPTTAPWSVSSPPEGLVGSGVPASSPPPRTKCKKITGYIIILDLWCGLFSINHLFYLDICLSYIYIM